MKQSIAKFLSYQPVISENDLKITLEPEMSIEYFTKMRDVVEPYLAKNKTTNMSDRRATNRANIIKLLIPEKFKIGTILDIGCSNGKITESLASVFPSAKVFGTDVRKDPNLDTSKFEFIELDPADTYPFEDNSVDLITLMAVLHHVENLEFLLDEIHRILRPGGIVIIREHDCRSRTLAKTLDVIHGLYACVLNEPQEETPEEFIANHYAKYRTREEWISILDKHGLIARHFIGTRDTDLQRMYFMSFRKITTNSFLPKKRLNNQELRLAKSFGQFVMD